MAYKSFPPPGTFQWSFALRSHLEQLLDPQYGGINTWLYTPTSGADGRPLSIDHKGYTGLNLSTYSLELWTGTEWLSFQSGGSSNPPLATRYEFPFDSTDVSQMGVVHINHGLPIKYPHISVWDDGDDLIIPDKVHALGSGVLELHLQSFTVTGVWRVCIS